MINYDVLSKNIERKSCFESNIIIPIANLWERDYYYYFLDYYPIIYSKINSTSILHNNNIHFGSRLRFRFLNNFTGIGIDRIENSDDNYERIVELIEKINYKEYLVGTLIDSYCIPWNKYYHKINRNHALLIYDYDPKSLYCNCFDGYLTDKFQLLEFGELLKYSKMFFIITKEIQKAKMYNISTIHECIIDSINNIGINECINNIRLLLNDIIDMEFMESDYLARDDLNNFEFLLKLTNISWNRANFAESLMHFDNKFKCNSFKEMYSQILNCSNNWMHIKNLLSKGLYVIPSKILDRLKTLADSLLLEETKLYNLFSNL